MQYGWSSLTVDHPQSIVDTIKGPSLRIKMESPDRSSRPCETETQASGDLFTVDTIEGDGKVLRCLHDWAEVSTS